MSSIKVSALTAKTSPSGSEELLINDGGTSKKITIANLTKGHDLPAVPSGIADNTNKEYNLKLTDVSGAETLTWVEESTEVPTTPSGIANDTSKEYNLKLTDVGGTETLTWIEETDNDTTYSNFAGTTAGLVPTSTSSDDTKFLRADGTWVVPTDTDTDTTYSNFSGTAAGLVPTSTSSDDTKFLRADGTWVVPTDTDTTYAVGDGGLTTNDFTTDDHTKLGNIATSANNYTHPTSAGNEHLPSDVSQTEAGYLDGVTSAIQTQFGNKRFLPVAKAVNYTAVDGDSLIITAGSITITLPASPTAGDTVVVKDGTGAAATTNWTVARNSSNIASSATDLTFDKNWTEITMTYVDTTIGWSV